MIWLSFILIYVGSLIGSWVFTRIEYKEVYTLITPDGSDVAFTIIPLYNTVYFIFLLCSYILRHKKPSTKKPFPERFFNFSRD